MKMLSAVGVRDRVRDRVSPQVRYRAYRSTHLLGNRVSSPPPAPLCVLARHLCQFDRVGGLVGTQAVRRHPQAAAAAVALGASRHSSIATPGLETARRVTPRAPLA